MTAHADLAATIDDAWEKRADISTATKGPVRDAVVGPAEQSPLALWCPAHLDGEVAALRPRLVQVVLLRGVVELADHVRLAQENRLIRLERTELVAHLLLGSEFRLDLRARRGVGRYDGWE